ncbi:hypothetical protein FKM82_029445 [Ascaphus truei]
MDLFKVKFSVEVAYTHPWVKRRKVKAVTFPSPQQHFRFRLPGGASFPPGLGGAGCASVSVSSDENRDPDINPPPLTPGPSTKTAACSRSEYCAV